MHEGWRVDWGLSARQGDRAICPSKGLIQPKAQATDSSICNIFQHFSVLKFLAKFFFLAFWFCRVRRGYNALSSLTDNPTIPPDSLNLQISQESSPCAGVRELNVEGGSFCDGFSTTAKDAFHLGWSVLSQGEGVFTAPAGWKRLAMKRRCTHKHTLTHHNTMRSKQAFLWTCDVFHYFSFYKQCSQL